MISILFLVALAVSVLLACTMRSALGIALTWVGMLGFLSAVIGIVFVIGGEAVVPDGMPGWSGLVLVPVGLAFVVLAAGVYRFTASGGDSS